MARESSLGPFLGDLAAFFNHNFIGKCYADPQTGEGPYELFFTGARARDKEAVHKRRVESLGAGLTSINREMDKEDMPPFRDPDDPDLWDSVMQRARDTHPEWERDPRYLDQHVAKAYLKLGGKLRRWTDMPIAPSALQAQTQEVQQEQQEAQQAQMEEQGGAGGFGGEQGGFGGAGGPEGPQGGGESQQQPSGPQKPAQGQRQGQEEEGPLPKGSSWLAKALAGAGKRVRRGKVLEITIGE